MKLFSILFSAVLLFGVFAAAQQHQTVEVVKSVSANPTIGITGYTGNPETKARLLSVLERSGWFKPARKGGENAADVRLNVNAGAAGIQAKVSAGGRDFEVRSSSTESELQVLELADEVLRVLFNVKALCTQKIYFVATAQNNLKEIYSCYLDGTGQERVTHNNGISTEPGWGHKDAMVYTLARNNALSVVLSDMGKNRQRIVSREPGLNASAGLSRDGTKLALPLSSDNQVDLYVLDLRNGNKTRLTKDRNVESSPCWSPDGERIVYVSDKLGVPQLYLRSAVPGGKEIRLTSGNRECVSPDWSNVSNKLCFSMKNNEGSRVIAVIDMSDASYSAKVVTSAAGNWEAPSWGPDGRNIVCTRGTGDGSRDLYLLDSWTGAFRPVSRGAKLSLPAWRPAY